MNPSIFRGVKLRNTAEYAGTMNLPALMLSHRSTVGFRPLLARGPQLVEGLIEMP
jgi:hypothetical protein